MKYLVVLFVVCFAIWHWRKNRRDELRDRAAQPKRPAPPPAVGAPQAMLRCAHCGLHLPEADAVRGTHGMYCSAAHRLSAER